MSLAKNQPGQEFDLTLVAISFIFACLNISSYIQEGKA
jgi:hypothetical protein